MARTAQMPKSVQSDVPMDAVGEALLQHYNVGIENPWYKIGKSDQETYNRRKLPWAGKTYNVDEAGDLTGDNPEVPEKMARAWEGLAKAARTYLEDENFGDLETLYEEGLEDVGSELRGRTYDA